MDNNTRQQIETILNRHDEAIRELQAARVAMVTTNRGLDDAISATRLLLDGLAKANAGLERMLDAHGQVVDAALRANQAALQLLRSLP